MVMYNKGTVYRDVPLKSSLLSFDPQLSSQAPIFHDFLGILKFG